MRSRGTAHIASSTAARSFLRESCRGKRSTPRALEPAAMILWYTATCHAAYSLSRPSPLCCLFTSFASRAVPLQNVNNSQTFCRHPRAPLKRTRTTAHGSDSHVKHEKANRAGRVERAARGDRIMADFDSSIRARSFTRLLHRDDCETS